MRFGKKVGDVEVHLAGGGQGGGDRVWFDVFQSDTGGKDRKYDVQLLAEPADWIDYYEHYSDGAVVPKGYFPCPGRDAECPGCKAELRSSHRYAAPVFYDGATRVFKIQATLAKRLMARAMRSGQLMGQDLEVWISGKGLDMDFEVEPGGKRKLDPSIVGEVPSPEDVQDKLAKQYDFWHGKQDWSVPEELPAQEEKPPFEPAVHEAAAQEVEEVDVDELIRMDRKQLIALADRHGFEVDREGSKQTLLAAIIRGAQ